MIHLLSEKSPNLIADVAQYQPQIALQASKVRSLLENLEFDAYLKDEFTGLGTMKVYVSSIDMKAT